MREGPIYTLRDIRGAYKTRNSWWGYFCLHPLASVLLLPIANNTKVRPELLCISSFLVGLSALPFFADGSHVSLVAGAILAYVSNLLDGMDGKLARLKNQVTVFGGYLDSVCDIGKHCLYVVALTFGQYRYSSDLVDVAAGFLAFAAICIPTANENILGRLRILLPVLNDDRSAAPEAARRFTLAVAARRVDDFFAKHSLLPAPSGVEATALMTIIGPAFDAVTECFFVGGFFLLAFTVTRTLVTLRRTRLLTVGYEGDRQREKLRSVIQAQRASEVTSIHDSNRLG
jgi:hypothetical protein